jgi:putative SOS response-associated peptidase YedK
MCGRFTLRRPASEIATALEVVVPSLLQPRFNIAPTQQVLTVRQADAGRTASFMRWGLLPPWGTASGAPLINAKSETAASKPTFRTPFKKRRCLVPADGFFEWKTEGKKKFPRYFTLNDGGIFTFAGLWETCMRDGEQIESVCVLTTTANELVRGVHDRMPVILPPIGRLIWLDPASDGAALQELLGPYPAEAMLCRPVSTTVNSARNEGPECIAAPEPAQGVLF